MSAPFSRGISLVSFGFNEEKLIRTFLEKAWALLKVSTEDYEIIFVDDGSTDRTLEIARAFQKECPYLRIHSSTKNQGALQAWQEGIRLASKDYIFWQTVDWSYDLGRFPLFLEKMTPDTVVMGVRRQPVQGWSLVPKVVRGGSVLFSPGHLEKRSDNSRRGFISAVNYALVRMLFLFPLSDYQNIMIVPAPLIKGIKIESRSSFGSPEILLKAHWSGAAIVEVPVAFIPRSAGQAKGARPAAIFASVTDIFRLWWRWVVLGRRGEVRMGTITRLNPAEWMDSSDV
jgi:hypothetical protein